MYWVRVVLGVTFGLIVFAFLDYTLPSQNTVRITNTYSRLTAITPSNQMFYAGDDAGTVENQQGLRDVRFIDTVRPNGRVFVYRNEDTGWLWPPYFKYDSSNLHGQATDLRSSSDNPRWVSVTGYGWRMPWLSTYPNAISIRPVAGPEVRATNWAALIVLGVMMVLLLTLWRMWAQFRQRTIDPAVQRVDAGADRARGRLSRWLGR
ncbi:MAG: DUF1523 family protein [Paracoccus sp. (in: a-proteobacteria)]|uniref:DUF1523 family protein n=1 Tax=Paracoccus sp. TaxID=267 RepID=UPI0026E07399|nr:DUF1523 family protein [Paracoccus sp. (in: a-proteobacteria)]MDO5612032.1 DUF1523 family protein [Paracoccus sp. (in: a-proteobacteria)]